MSDKYITPEEYIEAEKNGVNADNLEARIRKLGWSHRRAIMTPVKKRKDHSKWYPIAEKNGIAYDTYTSRIARGWTPARAATESPLSRSECGLAVGRKAKRFPIEVLDLLEENGIAYQTFHARVRSGWDPKEAASHPIISKSEAGKRSAAKMKARKTKGVGM